MSFSFCLIAKNRNPLKLKGGVLKRCPRISFVIKPYITGVPVNRALTAITQLGEKRVVPPKWASELSYIAMGTSRISGPLKVP